MNEYQEGFGECLYYHLGGSWVYLQEAPDDTPKDQVFDACEKLVRGAFALGVGGWWEQPGRSYRLNHALKVMLHSTMRRIGRG